MDATSALPSTRSDFIAPTSPTARPETLIDADPAEIAARRARRRAAEHQQHLAKVRAAIRQSADSIVSHRAARWATLPLTITPAPESSAPIARLAPAPTDAEVVRRRQQRVDVIRRIYARLSCGDVISPGALDVLIEELADDARLGIIHVARACFNPTGIADDLADHAFAVGTLCLGMGWILGYSAEDLRAAALSGFLADVGLTLIPHDIRSAERPLTEIETNALHRHPAWSAALLELIRSPRPEDALPECVQMAVFQHHERPNGTGYPNRLPGARTHDLARLVAVADSYAGMLAPRAHRPALTIPEALTALARQAGAGLLDKQVVRALLHLIGTPPARAAVTTRTASRAA